MGIVLLQANNKFGDNCLLAEWSSKKPTVVVVHCKYQGCRFCYYYKCRYVQG
jgi:hypothetical protein